MLAATFKQTLRAFWFLPALSLLVTLIIFLSPLKKTIVPGFLGYHTLLESFCIVISLMIFTTQFVLRKYTASGLYQILGIPYLGIGIIDLLHSLSYQGLPDLVTPNTPQKSIAFWFAARFLEAATFLYFALHSKYKWTSSSRSEKWIYGGLVLYISVTTLAILTTPNLIPQFTDTQGHINDLKKSLEYLLILGHLFIFYNLMTTPKSNGFTEQNRDLLASASLVIAVSGLCFSSFSAGHDLIIFTGHVLKVVAYYFIFKAALQSELLQPYHDLVTLNHELQLHSESLRNIKSQLLKSERLNAVGINAGMVLHDLNNMMQIADISAKKILKLASENESAEKIKNYSNTLVNSLTKTRNFQQLLLQQVKNQDPLEMRLDLQQELNQFAPLLKILAGENELIIECEANLFVHISQVELEQVIMNLVVNARDAMAAPPGKIRILAKMSSITAPTDSLTGVISPGNYIQLSVIDNGCGIPAESFKKIFEPFYTTKEYAKGTGLGLPTIRYIVERSKAFLALHSTLGKGTEFTIYFKEIAN